MRKLVCILFSLIAAETFAATTAPSTQPAFEIVGHIDLPAISESSGVVASRKYPGVYWTHNDSGNPAEVFAINRQGKSIATFVIRARNEDWEDIANDEEGHLYLADIGDNACRRKQVQVYRVAEPDPHGPGNLLITDRVWRLNYPDGPYDAESLFILDGFGYVIKKYHFGNNADVYRFKLDEQKPAVMEHVMTLPLRMPVTAADISRDHKWLALMTVVGPYLYRIDGDVKRASAGEVWHEFFLDKNIEGVCFVEGGLLATTEGRQVVMFHLNLEQINADIRSPTK
jgi:hypothetical protein